jgi:hypothetical protein
VTKRERVEQALSPKEFDEYARITVRKKAKLFHDGTPVMESNSAICKGLFFRIVINILFLLPF